MASLSSLPNEIKIEILHYLPIRSLLDFGSTSRENRALQLCSLSSLRLGVFHTKLNGMVNHMEAKANNDCLHSVQIILPRTESRNKDFVIYLQNQRIKDVVQKYKDSLRNLEIAMWELQADTAVLLAQLNNLKHLHIRLDHPYTRHPAVTQGFWQDCLGSTVWNLLGSKADNSDHAFGRLQTLRLERAGITDYQLRKILGRNHNIKGLYLRKCHNLTKETFRFLATSKIGQQLERFEFTMCDSEQINNSALDFVGRLSNLKSLSLKGCRYIESELVKKLNEHWMIPELLLPSQEKTSEQGLDIDPAYR